MVYRAKVVRNGGSQAVRLPKECQFEDQGEVVAKKEGRQVILEPLDEWPPDFLDCLGGLGRVDRGSESAAAGVTPRPVRRF
jgi:antitoxin VapB